MQALKAWQCPKILAHKWGGGGATPKGEFNGQENQFHSGGKGGVNNHSPKLKESNSMPEIVFLCSPSHVSFLISSEYARVDHMAASILYPSIQFNDDRAR